MYTLKIAIILAIIAVNSSLHGEVLQLEGFRPEEGVVVVGVMGLQGGCVPVGSRHPLTWHQVPMPQMVLSTPLHSMQPSDIHR